MPDAQTLKDAVEDRGPYAVWALLDEDEQRTAAATTWTNADREEKTALQMTVAKAFKFRPQSVLKLPAERVAGRLARLAKELPETVLFQFLFHLHMEHRRPLLVEFLDAVGLPHDNGVLDLPDDAEPPDGKKVTAAAGKLVEAHGRDALVYLATLKVADDELWAGVDEVLDGYDENGEQVE